MVITLPLSELLFVLIPYIVLSLILDKSIIELPLISTSEEPEIAIALNAIDISDFINTLFNLSSAFPIDKQVPPTLLLM